jgi:hypothetical protein
MGRGFLVVLFDGASGKPICTADAGAITGWSCSSSMADRAHRRDNIPADSRAAQILRIATDVKFDGVLLLSMVGKPSDADMPFVPMYPSSSRRSTGWHAPTAARRNRYSTTPPASRAPMSSAPS